MTGNLRRHIALTMALLLAIFTICQAHAMTEMPASKVSSALMMSHDSESGDKHLSMPCCQGDCQNQQADLAKKPPLPDSSSLMMIASTYPDASESSVLRVSAHVHDRAQGDPHPLLRFQRFLE